MAVQENKNMKILILIISLFFTSCIGLAVTSNTFETILCQNIDYKRCKEINGNDKIKNEDDRRIWEQKLLNIQLHWLEQDSRHIYKTPQTPTKRSYIDKIIEIIQSDSIGDVIGLIALTIVVVVLVIVGIFIIVTASKDILEYNKYHTENADKIGTCLLCKTTHMLNPDQICWRCYVDRHTRNYDWKDRITRKPYTKRIRRIPTP